MDKQSIQQSIEINAPKEVVWEVLLQDKFTRIWYEAFSEGTRAETDWQVGSKAVFTDNSGNGIVGTVITNQPYESIELEYQGMINDGVEVFDTKEAQAVKGSRESYRLEEQGGKTRLFIALDMEAEFVEDMSAAWEQALQKIKELSQSQSNAASANS